MELLRRPYGMRRHVCARPWACVPSLQSGAYGSDCMHAPSPPRLRWAELHVLAAVHCWPPPLSHTHTHTPSHLGPDPLHHVAHVTGFRGREAARGRQPRVPTAPSIHDHAPHTRTSQGNDRPLFEAAHTQSLWPPEAAPTSAQAGAQSIRGRWRARVWWCWSVQGAHKP